MTPLATIELGPAYTRAAFEPTTYDESSRSVELVWSTGADVVRRDWDDGRRFIESLSMDPKHVRLDRLNAGASVLDNHSAYDLRSIIGVVERAWIQGNEGRARVRFSERAEVQEIVRDVRAGIIRHVSVGYRVHKFRDDTDKAQTVKRMTAIDWEPFEVSLVTIPADAKAGVRSADQRTNPCEVTRREADMPDETFGAGIGDETRSAAPTAPAPVPTPRTPPVDLDAVRREAATAERARVTEIREHCRALRLDDTLVDEMIDSGRSLADQLPRIRAAFVERQAAIEGPETRSRVTVGTEDITLKREAATAALFARMNPSAPVTADLGELRGRSLIDLMRFGVAAREGERAALRMTRDELFKRSLHTTADFPLLLQESTRRTLRAQFEAQETTYQKWCGMGTLTDFRPTKRVQIGDAPNLAQVVEGASITYGTVGEGSESIELASYGKGVALSFQAIINDDLGGFSRLVGSQARKVAVLAEQLAYAQLTGGTVGGSSLYSTSSPNRANYTSGGTTALTADAAGIKAIDMLAQKMKNQTSLSGTDFISLRPKYLIVPTALELTAMQLLSPIVHQAQGNVNPYRGSVEAISTPYITATAVEYYLAADANAIDTIEVAWLEGRQGPQLTMEECSESRGVKFHVWADLTAKAIDYRGLAKSKGAA